MVITTMCGRLSASSLSTVGAGSPRWMIASASSKKARISRMKVETRKPRNTGPTVSEMT